MKNLTMEKLVNYCKQYGFIFQGSEIYGGLANTWDYGPLGSRLKNNIKDSWRKRFIQERPNAYEVDAAILMHPRVWEASGHVSSFSDPLIDCKNCKMRHRVDNLIDEYDENAHADGPGLLHDQVDQVLSPGCTPTSADPSEPGPGPTGTGALLGGAGWVRLLGPSLPPCPSSGIWGAFWKP